MAQRPITAMREVIGEEVKNVTDYSSFGFKAVEIAGSVMKQNAEAKILESLSRAQLDLNEMQTQFQIDNQSNPVGASKEFSAKREALFNQYAQQIPSNYRYLWNEKARELGFKSDLANQSWAFKQARENTVSSINESVKNNIKQSYFDGQAFASGGGNIVSSMANFATSKQNMLDLAAKNLGPEDAKKLLSGFESDALKSFLSGVAEKNPVAALNILSDENVKNQIDVNDYLAIKSAAEGRALNLEQLRVKSEILDAIKSPNSILAEAGKRPLSFVEIEEAARKHNFSEDTKEYLLKRAGYKAAGESKGSGSRAFSKEEKEKMADLVLDGVGALLRTENPTIEDMRNLQDSVYSALNAGALSESEGEAVLRQLITPFADKAAENAKQFNHTRGWRLWDNSHGYGQLQDFFEKEVAYKVDFDKNGVPKQPKSHRLNQKNRLELFTAYTNALEDVVTSEGKTLADIPNLTRTARQKLFDAAFLGARETFLKTQDRRLAELKELPNFIMMNGRKIESSITPKSMKPDVVLNAPFTVEDEGGYITRVYKDGRRVRTGTPSGMFIEAPSTDFNDE